LVNRPLEVPLGQWHSFFKKSDDFILPVPLRRAALRKHAVEALARSETRTPKGTQHGISSAANAWSSDKRFHGPKPARQMHRKGRSPVDEALGARRSDSTACLRSAARLSGAGKNEVVNLA
jgi:hypothetical protein